MYKFLRLCHFIRKIVFNSPHSNLGDLTTTIFKKTASFPILVSSQYTEKEAARFKIIRFLRVIPTL